jgi:hypothetical protein
MQALPPGVNIGVNADCSYDAEGMGLITDPDESESIRHSDDEDDEETGYTCPLHSSAFGCVSVTGLIFSVLPLTLAFCSSIHSASLGVRFAEGPEVIHEDSEQHSYAPPPTPSATPAPYPEPMHPSAPSFSVTLDAQLLQLTVSISYHSFLCPVFSYTKIFQIPLASLPLKLHPIPSMAKGSLVSVYQCVFMFTF